MKYFKFIVFLLVLCTTSTAYATIMIDIQEIGTDIVVSYSGTLDLNSTAYKDADRINNNNNCLFDVGNGAFQTYNVAGSIDDYNLVASSITYPVVTDLFSQNLSGGTIAGDFLLIDIWSEGGQIWLSDGYVSNTFFAGTNTFSNSSFLNLSPTIGTFEWSWYNGISSDNLILTVGQASSVPEPSTFLLLGSGLAGLGFYARKRKRA